MPSSAGHHSLDRRVFLRNSLGVSAGLIAAPTLTSLWQAPEAKAATAFAAFVDDYSTNTTANQSAETNAVVRALGGFAEIWKTGGAWNTGTPLLPEILRDNMRYCARLTGRRTEAQAREAFVYDRQHQSYAMIGGLGPLADLYRTGAKAVTSITAAPDGIPATKINDAIPAGAPAGSALGAGSYDSDLGLVAKLVDTVRGDFTSSNPAKFTFQYPRPWRMSEDSEVVDTGEKDALGFPVYDSDVVVVTQLLRQRSEVPAEDGGFPSGHTNAFHLAALAYAYAVPERFQEIITRAFELSHTRIMSGMHSTVDVMGGRIMATALAAAVLHKPENTALKAAARKQAAEYFQARTGTTADTLFAYAHSDAGDRYADRGANASLVEPKLTYVLRRRGDSVGMTVPKGAEVLLETRLPYLDAAQRREVLRTTALPSGYVLLDGWEQWGRLNLFAAADGYGAFDTDVTVTLDAALGGFAAADAWRNDIDGKGGLVKCGSGTLTLTGTNRYKGDTVVEAGVLAAGSEEALGRGDVRVKGGTLATGGHSVRVRGDYTQAGVLDVTLDRGTGPALDVDRRAVLERGSRLVVRFDAAQAPRSGDTVAVIGARSVQGRFAEVSVAVEGWTAEQVFTAHGVSVHLRKK
ncbi:autotransporter-associated beta strand repeat-containing protein [Streptomyces sp. 1222.2]|uniref:phosphatase PAP2 family protein n=1 Tax=Streptomyces sp. 1222.2 TaxID=1938833 RepID=UPI000BD194DF|nr:phosphatase PAP2 family protein [Streptomyces sp. 1222.2]SOD66999.1 autotransporter-associated beta strand repeat-containing protein [Streptomyces sp. 1222.2]